MKLLEYKNKFINSTMSSNPSSIISENGSVFPDEFSSCNLRTLAETFNHIISFIFIIPEKLADMFTLTCNIVIDNFIIILSCGIIMLLGGLTILLMDQRPEVQQPPIPWRLPMPGAYGTRGPNGTWKLPVVGGHKGPKPVEPEIKPTPPTKAPFGDPGLPSVKK